jgi:polar amino acid transport system substrate-binding protein
MKRLACLLLPALFCLGSCSPVDDNALVVGMEMQYPPFEMRSTDNQPDGISVRMAEDLAAHLGRPLRLEDVAWDGIIPSLQAGKIDLIISSLTRTDERAETIDFSDPYVTNGLCMLVGKDSPIRNADDLPESNAKIAVKLGTTGHSWALAHLEGVDLVVLDEAGTCALEVAQGKADAFIYDQISIYQLWKRHEDKTRAILQPIREEKWAIGIRKGEDELRGQVNAWLKSYREQGKFDALADRYMAAEKKTFEEMGVPFIFH